MVFTHIPSNLLLILVPLMPTLPLAIAVPLLASPALMGMPFILAGGLKILHDVLLFIRFRVVRSRK